MIKEYGLVCNNQEILQTTVDKDAFPTRMVAELGPLNRCLPACLPGDLPPWEQIPAPCGQPH